MRRFGLYLSSPSLLPFLSRSTFLSLQLLQCFFISLTPPFFSILVFIFFLHHLLPVFYHAECQSLSYNMWEATSHTLCSKHVLWCHIMLKWPSDVTDNKVASETHKVPLPSCLPSFLSSFLTFLLPSLFPSILPSFLGHVALLECLPEFQSCGKKCLKNGLFLDSSHGNVPVCSFYCYLKLSFKNYNPVFITLYYDKWLKF